MSFWEKMNTPIGEQLAARQAAGEGNVVTGYVLGHAAKSQGVGGLWIDGDTLHFEGQSQPVIGVTATVDAEGAVDRRTTVTRLAVGAVAGGLAGVVAGGFLKKKNDNRSLFITVDGADFQWSVSVPPKDTKAAHKLVAQINTLARN